jgi:translation initiation factor 2 beta subunit (eIF-2beta)/eIF-5
MDAVRCLECGATRWALFGQSFEHLLGEPCEVCGGETVVERRRPGTGAAKPFVERRDHEEHSSR